MDRQEFIRKNDLAVNRLTGLILLIVVLIVFPIMILLTILGFFNIPILFLGISGGISTLLIVTTYIMALKRKAPVFVKYSLIFIGTLVVGVLASDVNIGISMTYLIPCILSCLYYDRMLTWTALGIGVINVLYTQQLRYFTLNPGETIQTFIPIALGILTEFLVLFLVFNLLIKRIIGLFSDVLSGEEQRNLLESIKSARERASRISGELQGSIGVVGNSLNHSAQTNNQIAENAVNAANRCETNLNYVQNSSAFIVEISQSLKNISEKADELDTSFRKSYETAAASQEQMTVTINDMKMVEENNKSTHDVMLKLLDASEQIGSILTMIDDISTRTNMLALNASIESARAGEAGKGFAVVSDEIRKLAEQTDQATKEVSGLVKDLETNTRQAVNAMETGFQNIQMGIGRINETGRFIEQLMNVQEDTRSRMQDITNISLSSGSHSQKLLEVTNDIQEYLNGTLKDMQSIAQSTEEQTASLEEVTASFHSIEQSALDLKNAND